MDQLKRRTGRKEKAPEDRQNIVIAVLVTKAEHEALVAESEGRGMKPSAYLRDLGLGRHRQCGTAIDLLEIAERVERLLCALPESGREELIAIVAAIDEAARRRS